MRMTSWFVSLRRRLGSLKVTKSRRTRQVGTSCWLERLEDRIVPAIITVTSAADDLIVDGQVTLREAIQAANTNLRVDGSTAGSGADTIQFASGLTGQTITLGGTALQITSPLTINGLGADQLSISGNNTSRIFAVFAGNSVTISGLTLTNGSATDFGGGIFNRGTLAMNNITLSGNSAGTSGGAIASDGTLTISNSALSGNTATNDGGGIDNSGGTLTRIIHASVSGQFFRVRCGWRLVGSPECRSLRGGSPSPSVVQR